MRIHGTVSLALFALSAPAFCQELPLPRLLGSPDLPQRNFESRSVPPRSPVPPRAVDTSVNSSILESELEALRADLQAFHAVSEDVARSARDVESKSDRSANQQRQEVLDLLTKLATQGINKKSAKEQTPAPQVSRKESPALETRDSEISLTITDSTVDAFALGKVLFKSGEFQKAEQAFRKVAQTDDNRELLKYLIATCQYRRKRITEATEGYRELAASNKDPVIRDLAKFQLDGIRWLQQVEQELDQLRKDREKAGSRAANKPVNETNKSTK